MELRWYQTYDKNGVESPEVLQYREDDWHPDLWEDVPSVRERESNYLSEEGID